MTVPASPAQFSAPDSAGPRQDEFTVLVTAYRPPLLRYVLGLLPGDPQRAEDAVQETVLRAWLAGFAERADVSETGAAREPCLSWLFTVARNVVIDWSRRDRVRPALPTALPPETAVHTDEHERVLARTQVVELLARLSRPHREVLVYTYLLGCSGPDTAHALGIPAGTVKSRLHHAIRDVRRAADARQGCA
ncbi:sigma-70 family RNA polymerase sigma factor [Streptomyces sp. H27-D2]|uniref:sigma-70 family RNA polymerase sigma factor n=1 Tax=Streptomyces sp. H27-D2 TaxID=3046304 RepID=UPI002DBB4889|nr:sigma-70 family RNA polymerase sigma factor [Streptomyces sp. H27-D2]MEC4020308.1 sigma-70 family RNA polymerase sigma factor [Streptomyces sp. H27-D2]